LPQACDKKGPRGFPAGAIPTVDFLLHDFGRVVKKTRVKSHDRSIPLGHHWPATDEIEALGSGALGVRHAPDSGAKAEIAGSPSRARTRHRSGHRQFVEKCPGMGLKAILIYLRAKESS
jgi:hypothetical protein